ncbi:MAG: mechanosensitive ion channel [Bacteroidales bacterium]|nr:mechanosensitive ion channel [Candidatus Equibacterium intestinale]
MKKTLLSILTVLLMTLAPAPAGAVVKEKNIDLTVKRLHEDLNEYKENLDFNISQYEKQRTDHWAHLNKCMHECQEYTIVLYTQQENRLFGLSQACQNLEDLMEGFKKDQTPFEKWKGNFGSEIERYERLEQLLERISTRSLTTQGEEARKECITICSEIKERLTELQKEIYANDEMYEASNARISEMAEYNTARFEEIRHRVFMSGSDSFLSILGNLKENFSNLRNDLLERRTQGAPSKSAIRENVTVVWTIIIAALLSVAIAFILARILPGKVRNAEKFAGKRGFIIASLAVTLFIVLMFLCCEIFLQGFYILPSVKLLLEFLVIADIFLVSVTIRAHVGDVSHAFGLYTPIIFMAFCFITERLSLVSNNVVNMTIPLVLLAAAIWQLVVLSRHGKWRDRLSAVLLWATFIITAVLCIVSWCGYTFLALMLMMYWILQVTCLQAVTCIVYLLKLDDKQARKMHKVRTEWINPIMEKLVIPIMCIATFAISLRWAANMFSMSSWAEGILSNNFVAVEDGFTASLGNILIIIGLAFAFSWFISLITHLLKAIYKENYTTGPVPLYVTLGGIFLWFLYAVIATKILNIDSKGLIAAIGGMGVGLGFALKDTINDLFCGISLLMGRVHLHDYIECDGIRGKITEIGIRSTTVETLDGSVISFLNSQLFAKNFKNLTKNHQYEACTIDVGVAYGTDIEKARGTVLKAIEPMKEWFAKGKDPVVVVSNFGDSSVDLSIKVWIAAKDKAGQMAAIREAVYTAFNESGIEIPFPQTEVTIKKQ